MSGIFFDGRKIVSPATVSQVDDSAMLGQGNSVGNVLAIIGRAQGGEPKKPLIFGSPEQAVATLVGGDGADACRFAFDPSSQTGGPDRVIFFRVNPAVQASTTLLDSAGNEVLRLTSTNYGLFTNRIRVRIERSATVTGAVKVTTQLGDDYFVGNNLYRAAFNVRYLGSASSAVISVTNTSVALQAGGATVATIDLTDYPTIERLVDHINSYSDFSAQVMDNNGSKAALNGLDAVDGQDIKSDPYTVTGTLQAVVDWINGATEPLVNAQRLDIQGALDENGNPQGAYGIDYGVGYGVQSGGSLPPKPVNWTYLAGGSDGESTINDWAECLEALQGYDAQWVVSLSTDAAVTALLSSHLTYMSSIGRKERRGILGMPLGSSDAEAIDAAKLVNNDRLSLTHLGPYKFNAQGELQLYSPAFMAAIIGGAFAGSNPGTALTNKTLNIQGVERRLRNPTDTDDLIEGGVLCVEETDAGFKVVKSISTWITDDRYTKVEQSTGWALDHTVRNVRTDLDVLRGEKSAPQLLARAITITESSLAVMARPEPLGVGVLAGDENSPAYKNITATIEGDRLAVKFQCSPVIPANYITVTVYAVPYTGSAAA